MNYRVFKACRNFRQFASSAVQRKGIGLEKLLHRSPDDVVLTLAIRTPMCKAKKGSFKDTSSDALLYGILKSARERANIDPSLVGDIVVGACHPPSPCYEARAAALAAGFPEHVPVQAVNRLCSSGLMAIRHVSDSISRGDIDIGLAVGCESMSKNPRPTPNFESEDIKAHQVARDCAEPMGWTSENLAEDFNVTREEMDQYALLSHTRASKAQKLGLFNDEIVPIETNFIDPETQDVQRITVSSDDGIRHGTTLEGLAKARPAFPQWGKALSTGGNSSQVTDGAAAVLLMRRSRAEELGLPILCKHVATAVTGVSPRIMGVGPIYAIPKVLERAGLEKSDVDLYEINEAFSSMYVHCVRELDLDIDKVNVNGGAIAFGHPLGATGVRQVVTGLAELRRRDSKILCTSMCVGSGMGAAAIFVNENAQSRV